MVINSVIVYIQFKKGQDRNPARTLIQYPMKNLLKGIPGSQRSIYMILYDLYIIPIIYVSTFPNWMNGMENNDGN